MSTRQQTESPDGRELVRISCPKCGHQVAIAIWCHNPACCDQSPEGFIDTLLPAEAARGVPVFAVRYLDPLPPPGEYSPDVRVRIWRPGNLTPVFTGTDADAIRFEMQHDCPAARMSGA